MYVRFPLSLRQVEDLLHERGIDVSYETVRFWWNRFGPVFAAEIRKKRSTAMLATPQWSPKSGGIWTRFFLQINGNTYYHWRAVDHEGEVLETFVTKRRDRRVALKFIKKTMKRFGRPEVIVPVVITTGKLRSYRAAMKIIGNEARQETKGWFNNRAENSHQPFRKEIKLSENERWQSLKI